MSIIVQKYGGSSVADVPKILDVARRIASFHQMGVQLVVVVSAMGNTTSELIGLAKQVSPDPDRREMDMLVSVGERISMSLLAMALKDLGVPARSLTGSQSGIITDGAHANARVVEIRPDRIRQGLEEGRVMIVAGFQGVSRSREITTLGRGGSDTTAVVLAAALGAEYCEICSDVDGVWSADPRVVKEAARQDALSLDVALSLARGGAKVLYEEAVRFARDQGVEIRAARTFGPGSGTRLQPGKHEPSAVIAVTGDAHLISLTQADPADDTLLKELIKHGVRWRRRSGQTIFGDIRNVHAPLSELVKLDASLEVAFMVTAVGSALGESLVLVAQLTKALEDGGVRVSRHGSAGDVVWWQVPEEGLEDGVRIVHQRAHLEQFKPRDE